MKISTAACVRSAAIAIVALGAIATGTGPASASTTNGEHVVVGASRTSQFTSVLLIGTNQLGGHVESNWVPLHIQEDRAGLPSGPKSGGDSYNWYKGQLQINWYTGDHQYSTTTYCDIPPSKKGKGTYVRCIFENGQHSAAVDAGF